MRRALLDICLLACVMLCARGGSAQPENPTESPEVCSRLLVEMQRTVEDLGPPRTCDAVTAVLRRAKGASCGSSTWDAAMVRLRLLAATRCTRLLPTENGPTSAFKPSRNGPTRQELEEILDQHARAPRSRDCGSEQKCLADVERLEKLELVALGRYIQLVARDDPNNRAVDKVVLKTILVRSGATPEEAAATSDALMSGGGITELLRLETALRSQSDADLESLVRLLNEVDVEQFRLSQLLSRPVTLDSLKWLEYVRNPRVLNAWRLAANDRRLQVAIPENVRSALSEPEFSTSRLLHELEALSPEQRRQLLGFTSWVALGEGDALEAARTQRFAAESRLVISKPKGMVGCDDPTAPFRNALEEVFVSSSTGGLRVPTVVAEDDFAGAVRRASCECGAPLDGCGPSSRGSDPSCRAVLAIDFDRRPEGARARATIVVNVGGDVALLGSRLRNSVVSQPFAVGCDDRSTGSQIGAARGLAANLAQSWVIAGNAPIVRAPPPLRDRRGFALVLSGLPELTDENPRNDSYGVGLAVLDTALLTTTIVAGGASIMYRNDYSDGHRDSLDAANTALTVASVALAALIAERVFGMVTYELER